MQTSLDLTSRQHHNEITPPVCQQLLKKVDACELGYERELFLLGNRELTEPQGHCCPCLHLPRALQSCPQPMAPGQTLPQWCHSRAGPQLPTAMGPHKPGPHPGAGAALGDPNAPSPQGAAFFCSLTPLFILSSLVADTVKAHIAWQLKPEASAYKARRGRVAGACRYQNLHCNHKYGNIMPKNNLNSTPLFVINILLEFYGHWILTNILLI